MYVLTFKNYVLLGGIPQSWHHRTMGLGFSIIFDIIANRAEIDFLKNFLESNLETLENHLKNMARPTAGLKWLVRQLA